MNFEQVLNSVNFAGKCSLRQRSSLPSASGIYFVSDERNNLLYIGQATNLRSRWAGTGHHRYKQLARSGLDKITLSYALAPVAELDNLERQYIQALKPLLNDGRVKVYLPKKSPRLSELQRLLKLVSTPLFPSAEFMTDQKGKTVRRPAWNLFRGFVAGMYLTDSIPRVVLVCQQNMYQILNNSATHRTKKRFYIEGEIWKSRGGVVCYASPIWKFDARLAVFEFVEFFTLGNDLFEKVYPHLGECQLASAKLKKLNDTALLEAILQALPSTDRDKAVQDYLRLVYDRLQPVSPDFALDEKKIW